MDRAPWRRIRRTARGDEGEQRISDAFGAKLDRLAATKAEYDPGNVSTGNHNIRPTVPA